MTHDPSHDPFLDPFLGPPGTNPPRYPVEPPSADTGMGWLFGLLAVAILVGAITFLGITRTDQTTTAANPPAETTGQTIPPPR
jgi:hypothetical protein